MGGQNGAARPAADAAGAREVADFSAEVFSCSGLRTAMHVALQTGRPGEAMEYARQCTERYGHNDALLACMLRIEEAPAKWSDAKLRERICEVFPPEGPQRTSLETLRAAGRPDAGLRIGDPWRIGRRAGMLPGDILLSLNGWRLRTEKQYEVIQDWALPGEQRLILWRPQGGEAGEFREVSFRRAVPSCEGDFTPWQ